MAYPDTSRLKPLVQQIERLAELKHERGSTQIEEEVVAAEAALKAAVRRLEQLREDQDLAAREPDGLADIRELRAGGPRRLTQSLPPDYAERLAGALLARCAGCTLGAPVEFWTIDRMETLAREHGQAFPPTEYFADITFASEKRYETSPRRSYTRDHINGVPVDDDLVYTVLGLLIAEDHGPEFSTAEVADAWIRYLPFACTAEEIALANLGKGIAALRAAEVDNPYCEWIGASIRADPWGYLAAGWPERAAEMAYHDAFLSHRRQGIYAEMFFAASISAAFVVDDPVEALRVGLTEIPSQSAFSRSIAWALDVAPEVRDYRGARQAVEERFRGMHPTHAINNACLTVFGLTIGGTDVTRVIGETVAMGMDNDCTAATAGSIVGAVVGRSGVPEHWHGDFNDTLYTYLIGLPAFSIEDLLGRFKRQAERVVR